MNRLDVSLLCPAPYMVMVMTVRYWVNRFLRRSEQVISSDHNFAAPPTPIPNLLLNGNRVSPGFTLGLCAGPFPLSTTFFALRAEEAALACAPAV